VENSHLSCYLRSELKHVVDTVLARNGFFAHPKNLLLTMVTDERTHVRNLGLRRILKQDHSELTELGSSLFLH
jgi:hypothetical protein